MAIGKTAGQADTYALRTYCASNPNDFACIINYNHDTTAMEPIGGGVGYTQIYRTGNYNVTTKSGFETALSQASSSEKIFLDPDGDFDFSSQQYTAPAGVFIVSNRGLGTSEGAQITADDLFTDATTLADYLFTDGGTNVRFTGLRIRGPNAETDITSPDFFNAIKTQYGFMTVDNCLIEASNKWAIDMVINKNNYIHHNYIRFTRYDGFGYGVWGRGATTSGPREYLAFANISKIYGNLLEECRHEIAAAGSRDSSYAAWYNIIVDHMDSNKSFDRHSGSGYAGHITDIQYNIQMNNAKNFVFDGFLAEADKTDSENPGYMTFSNNYLDKSAVSGATNAGIDSNDVGYVDNVENNDTGGSWKSANQPTVTISESTTEIETGQSVTFTAQGTDPTNNHDVNCYYWYTNTFRNSNMTPGNTWTKTFTTAGPKNVAVRARNRTGLLSNPRCSQSIWVKASSNPPTLHDRLIEAWEFAESATEPKIGLHSGFTLNEVSAPSTVTGVFGNAIHIVGAKGLHGLASEFDNFNPYEGTVTVAMRIKPVTSMGTESFRRIFLTKSGDRGEYYLSYNANGAVNFRAIDNKGTDTSYGTSASSILALDTWAWVLIEVTNDVDNDQILTTVKVDNSTVISDTISASSTYKPIYNTQNKLVIGTYLYDSREDPNFIGEFYIDSVYGWARALTQDEQDWLDNSGSGRQYTDFPDYVPS